MPLVRLPYGTGEQCLDIPEDRFAGELVSRLREYCPGAGEAELIREALRHPTGSPGLSELAAGRNKIVLIASDHTRPVPSKLIVPQMLAEIRRGNPAADITILVATGCHRKTTEAELAAKFGEELCRQERILVHSCDDTAKLVRIGTLPSGGVLAVNRIAAEADLLVSEGFIEPHFFAGFSGGRKSVLPGIASGKTVMYNHNAQFIASEQARTGILENNPIHRDMAAAACMVRLAFIVNVVLNPEKRVVYAVAGDAEQAHEQGCAFLSSLVRVERKPADIVVTTNGGAPLDQNIYQAVKGMTAAEACVRKGGVIIMLARSEDGHGGESFHETFRKQKDLRAMMEGILATPPEHTIADQWQSQIFARVLLHASVVYVSEAEEQIVRDLHMIPARTAEEALRLADALLQQKYGPAFKGTVLAIPDGVSVIPC